MNLHEKIVKVLTESDFEKVHKLSSVMARHNEAKHFAIEFGVHDFIESAKDVYYCPVVEDKAKYLSEVKRLCKWGFKQVQTVKEPIWLFFRYFNSLDDTIENVFLLKPTDKGVDCKAYKVEYNWEFMPLEQASKEFHNANEFATSAVNVSKQTLKNI